MADWAFERLLFGMGPGVSLQLASVGEFSTADVAFISLCLVVGVFVAVEGCEAAECFGALRTFETFVWTKISMRFKTDNHLYLH